MAEGRGHLKVFIGMAPGVGKTYRMLQEGRAESESGRDVVVGYLEPHGRADTLAQAEGLEAVPRRTLTYRGTELSEMDLAAVLTRAPELCLIDELAHTNAAGAEHEKRYEDVREVLEAGIDVFSTVNIQHLESLGDQIERLTGARVRETIPDEILSGADEVVLIDLTPEALIARLRAGKVYRLERVPAALANFFKIENLAALRETALRQVAEGVEIRRLDREPQAPVRRDADGVALLADAAPQTISERLLAIVTLGEEAEHVVRRAWRSAQRLDGELEVLVVRAAARPPGAEDRQRLESLRRLCAMLGVHLRVLEGDDPAALAIDAARELGSTYVLIAAPKRRRGLRWLRSGGEGLIARLLEGLPGVDVRIVADPSLREGRAATLAGPTDRPEAEVAPPSTDADAAGQGGAGGGLRDPGGSE